MAEELDDIGRETAAMMRQMLQLATLVALRTRERGQKEAEARVRVTEARQKEVRERRLREAADAKARDPRNRELSRILERPTVDRGVSLEKDRFAAAAEATRMAAQQASRNSMRYDSVERRTALAQHLSRMGISPELQSVRMLMEVGQAQSAQDAVRIREQEAAQRRVREQEARERERERERTRSRERV
ncbi:hypothetical protein VMT65_10695 [Nocardia sp. CDC153]|uniref:hypothetical protein n=1 Tax=Nocardia sp. CDC153 TaxID=3112167 RepID=UPI002DC043FD|nr:hypothetical protein [Nocardia sp. CDC153]MEC3953499.1 hypothetical protein [Nocardia sp. CDC153]